MLPPARRLPTPLLAVVRRPLLPRRRPRLRRRRRRHLAHLPTTRGVFQPTTGGPQTKRLWFRALVELKGEPSRGVKVFT